MVIALQLGGVSIGMRGCCWGRKSSSRWTLGSMGVLDGPTPISRGPVEDLAFPFLLLTNTIVQTPKSRGMPTASDAGWSHGEGFFLYCNGLKKL